MKVEPAIPVNHSSVQPDEASSRVYVSPGMPALKDTGKAVSFFEFWPTWLIYLPVALQWLLLSLRHASLTLPLIANPCLRLSGMVGIPKSHLLRQAKGQCKASILPWFVYQVTKNSVQQQTESVYQDMQTKGFKFPLVCKPDIGCRGSGVKLIQTFEQLESYIASYPVESSIMLQELASHEAEAGVFFVREPNQPEGRIISLALKYMPYVVGDGKKTLQELIECDSRASELSHLYFERHKSKLDKIIPLDEPYRLVFSASHCHGAIFRDANELITPELTQRVNQIFNDLPEFYYGRMDIKFRDISSLSAGETIEIVEINTVSSEPLHIWDSETKLVDAMRSLLFQYRILFKLGRQNRQRGYKTPGLKTLFKHWRKESKLKQFYPETD